MASRTERHSILAHGRNGPGPAGRPSRRDQPDEPAHVHVDRDDRSAKLWLKPVAVAWSSGFASHEIRRIEKVVREHRTMILEAWNEHLG